ncbi:hypothetical protein K443DRAFT_403059 [Laccaria amethystina LaAM-08-1]|uniref:Uncharacterized protein n=1 Tax=Laccaria amethystina LaAM-08-1 TaxID=1095629 RepID=A0A0C9WQA2_9AGAR|nr:hypothetical protein K443DRAFT_403059 [Laccaria amethystina LaAM-08-1]
MNSSTPQGENPNVDSLAETVDLVCRVSETVSSEFYAWDINYCQETLRSLLVKAPTSHRYPTKDTEVAHAQKARKGKGRSRPKRAEEEFEILEITDGPEGCTSTIVPVEVVELDEALKPHPSYEACTPLMRSICVGDDPHLMPFMPFSDDPEFDYMSYNEQHKFFLWQIPNRDPDLEVIVVEIARRLHSEYQLSMEAIDKVAVLPLQLNRLVGVSRRRDYPKWLDFEQATSLPYQPPFSTASEHPHGQLPNLLRYFCNNSNCLVGYCTIHNEEEIPMPNLTPPLVTNKALISSVEKPCGALCFVLGSVSSSIPSVWTESEMQTLRILMDYSPDILPCDAAIICRKPCREIFKHRQDPPKTKKSIGKAKPITGTIDHDAETFIPDYPCSHPGPCDGQADCACFLNKAHCEVACRCDLSCPRRRRGCHCRHDVNGKLCYSARCPCYKAHRECDPVLCVDCDARCGDNASLACQNVSLQQGRFKRTEVRQSQWGLGLFLVEPAEKNDLIAEYIGELILDPTRESREIVATHRNRNYVFELNSAFSLDSGGAGNETRYINHQTGELANCTAKVRLVNGEHRIGIYALRKIKPEEEILFDYGSHFFQHGSQRTTKALGE